jgi:hypothetical protein
MGAFRHILTAAVLAIVFRWLWISSALERATVESGRKIFSPTRAIRLLVSSVGIVFAILLIWSSYSVRRPDEWWVPYLFLVFLALVPFMYPPVLTIEVDGIGSRAWFGSEKKIRWEDIASLHYNTGNNQFSVRDNRGRKITHGGFNADGATFLNEIRERTRLPLKIARPGTWKTETIEVPYEEIEADLNERA